MMEDLDPNKKYKCPHCSHVCKPDDMEGDYFFSEGLEDEVWSNWICPNCRSWHSPKDWQPLPQQSS